jgi:hypothetical protein
MAAESLPSQTSRVKPDQQQKDKGYQGFPPPLGQLWRALSELMVQCKPKDGDFTRHGCFTFR